MKSNINNKKNCFPPHMMQPLNDVIIIDFFICPFFPTMYLKMGWLSLKTTRACFPYFSIKRLGNAKTITSIIFSINILE